MGRLRLAAGPTNSLSNYVNVPTDYGTVIQMRRDLFLGELCAFDNQQDMYTVLDAVLPENPHLGLIDDAIALATDIWEMAGPLLDKIKKKNSDTSKPAVVTPPDPEQVLKGIDAGIWQYKQGALYFGPNHPLVKDITKHGMFKAGMYAAVAPNEIIAKLDPEYKAGIANATAPGGTGMMNNNTTKGGIKDWFNNLEIQKNPGGGLNIDLNQPLWKKPEVIIPVALVGGFLLSRLLK